MHKKVPKDKRAPNVDRGFISKLISACIIGGIGGSANCKLVVATNGHPRWIRQGFSGVLALACISMNVDSPM